MANGLDSLGQIHKLIFESTQQLSNYEKPLLSLFPQPVIGCLAECPLFMATPKAMYWLSCWNLDLCSLVSPGAKVAKKAEIEEFVQLKLF